MIFEPWITKHFRLSFRQYESYEEYEEVKNYLYQDFNDETGEITIRPFRFVQSPDLPFIAKASDKFILENMSTSPKVEPKHFCSGIRNAVRLILQDPDSYQSIFAKKQPRKYLFSDNERKWIRIKPWFVTKLIKIHPSETWVDLTMFFLILGRPGRPSEA